MLTITDSILISTDEVDMHAIRARGAGGQHVNKVSSAIHLRFDIRASSLPESCKERLLQLKDRRINSDGVIIIKAQQHRSQDKNKTDALNRLQELIRTAMVPPKKRRPTRNPRSAVKRRLESKNKRSLLKSLRKKVRE
ncbi:MAG: alternative ribosome rescue aminoacyl-tRNA hydrolase ArfB [Mariprofundus sp.]